MAKFSWPPEWVPTMVPGGAVLLSGWRPAAGLPVPLDADVIVHVNAKEAARAHYTGVQLLLHAFPGYQFTAFYDHQTKTGYAQKSVPADPPPRAAKQGRKR